MNLTMLVFAVCAACCIFAHGAILRSVVRSRTAITGGPVPRPRLAVEIVWAVLPALALVALLTVTWARARAHPRSEPAVVMRLAP